MPRKNRKLYPGAIYHVFDRGVARLPIFGDNRDRERFLEILEELHLAYNFVLHAYCLMGNHYHLLLQTYDANLPELMQRAMCKYAKHFNTKYERPGYLFQDRYDDRNVETEEYFVTLFRYLALNPVEDHEIKLPQNYYWSSYVDYYHGKQRYQFLEKKLVLDLFENYQMDSDDIHTLILCPDEFFERDYCFDTKGFALNDLNNLPTKDANLTKIDVIQKGLEALDLKPAWNQRLLVFLIKKYTSLPDKSIADIAKYSHKTSMAKVMKNASALFSSPRLAKSVSELEEKIMKS